MPIKLVKTEGSVSFKSNGIPMSQYNEQIAAKEAELEAEYTGTIESLEAEVAELTAEVAELETKYADCNFMHVPTSALTISGNCSHAFYFRFGNWLIEQYGDKITTKDISNAEYMFSYNNIDIPFDINLDELKTGVSCANMFYFSVDRESIPYIKGAPQNISGIFTGCYNLKEIPDDWADYIDWEVMHSYAYAGCGNVFNMCRSLRTIPQNLIDNLWSTSSYSSNMIYNTGFKECSALERVNGLPIYQKTSTSNMFSDTVSDCYRLEELTFAVGEDGSAIVVQWKNQTLNLSKYVGYANDSRQITNYSGLTNATKITDVDTYAALADSKDKWTQLLEYSSFNRTSLENLIASLPDTSSYLSSAGGTNTIKLKSGSGSATTAGSVDSISEETVAIASSRGWTLAFA